MKMRMVLLTALVMLVSTFVPSCVFAESNGVDQFETMKTLLETVFSQAGGGDVQISCNSSGFIIRETNQELTNTLLSAYIFDDQSIKASWKEYQTTMLAFYNSIYEFIETCGFDNPNLLYMLIDPFEPDEGDLIFLTVSNGNIVYDMLSE